MRPVHAGVGEGLVEDLQALLGTVDVGEVDLGDLGMAGVGHALQRPLGALVPPPPRRLRIERRRRARTVTLPGPQHAHGRITIEQVLEVGGAGAGQPGEDQRRRRSLPR